MADTSVAITAGSGTAIDTRTEGTNGNHRQVIVIGDPDTNAGVAPVTATGGLAVSPIVGATVDATVTRPADTTAYAANDAISDSTSAPTSGGFTLTGMARASGGSGILDDIVVTSTNDPATLLQAELWIFDQSITNVNDNAAFALSDTDVAKLVAVVPFTMQTTVAGSGTNSYAQISGLGIGYTCVGSANLRFLLKAKNAYTPASAEAIKVRCKVRWTT